MYWIQIPWLHIHGRPAPYGVFNERAIRATAGIMLLVGVVTFFVIYTTKEFTYLYPTLFAFWVQFLMSVLWWPRYAPFSLLGSWVVSNQAPDYVWAVQKRFAWGIGLAMATTMIVLTVWFGVTWWRPFAICMTCLFFMWMESTLGICVWCKIYLWLLHLWWIAEPEHRPTCPGGACEVSSDR